MKPTTTKGLELVATPAADSRGRPTVEVALQLGGVRTTGDVPAGASKGEDEAQTVPLERALANVHTVILPALQRLDADLATHAGLLAAEKKVIELAGPNFKDLGANAALPVSRALWRAAAALHGLPLWAYIRKHEPDVAGTSRVHFYMNIFNGGLHALKKADGEQLGRDRIDVQEIMVVPMTCKTYRAALEAGEKIDQALKTILASHYPTSAITRADEAGFSVKGLGDSGKAIGFVFEAIERAGFKPGVDVKLALDVAASSFYDAAKGRYHFQGRELTTDEMNAEWVKIFDRYPGALLSIEDGLAENDWAGWTKLTVEADKRGILTIGDDLFVTQMPRLEKGLASKAATAILIKVNQNGTVHGTLEVMKRAKRAGMQSVVSHRSGETLDDSIADLALATGALGLKTGDPQPVVDFPDPKTWVRRRKYLRMVEIEESAR